MSFPGFLAGTLAIAFTSRAQLTEVFRGGYKAVSRGEVEAAVAFCMPWWAIFRRVIMPLTLRFALPGMDNVWQVVLKESVLVLASLAPCGVALAASEGKAARAPWMSSLHRSTFGIARV